MVFMFFCLVVLLFAVSLSAAIGDDDYTDFKDKKNRRNRR